MRYGAQLLLKFLCLISHLSYSGGIYVGWEEINKKKSVSGVNVRLNCFIVCWGVLHVGEKERFKTQFRVVSNRKETRFSKKFTLNPFDSLLFTKCKFFQINRRRDRNETSSNGVCFAFCKKINVNCQLCLSNLNSTTIFYNYRKGHLFECASY